MTVKPYGWVRTLLGQEELTLRWLYQQRKLELTPLVPSEGAFRNISPTELVDPTEFLPPGSVVLLVGLSFTDTPDWETYVLRLVRAEVAAVGFGTGLEFDNVPTDLISAAQRHGLGLFEVPRSIPFVSIIGAVHRELLRRSQRATDRLFDVQETLNRVAFEGGVDLLIQELSRILSASICLIDADSRILGSAGAEKKSAEAFARSVVDGAHPAATNNEHRLVHRMNKHGDRAHYLVVVSDQTIPATERTAIKHCAGLLDILVQRPRYLRSRQAELNRMALALLLGADGSGPAMESIFAYAADAHGQVRPVIISADQQRYIERALTELDNNLGDSSRGLFALEISPGVVALLFRGTRTVSSIVEHFGAGAEYIRLAVGSPIAWRRLTAETFQELQMRAKTVSPGQYAGPERGVLRWTQDATVHALLAQRSQEIYGRLADYDRQHSTELTPTLSTFLTCGGHSAQTASNLGVHRHTVRTRLQKISEICEVDLDNPVTRAELLLVYVSQADG